MARDRYLLIGIVCFFVASLSCGYLATRIGSVEIKRQDLTASIETYDFGELRQDETVEGDFELTNSSNLKLAIVRITKQCSCTEAIALKTDLAPGETTKVRFEWTTGTSRGQVTTGLNVMYVLAGSKMKRLFAFPLKITAKVSPDFNYEPGELVFFRSGTQRKTIQFSANQMPYLILNRVYTDHRAFSTALSPSTLQVEVDFDPLKANNDLHEAYLSIETSSPRQPVCRIPIRIKDG